MGQIFDVEIPGSLLGDLWALPSIILKIQQTLTRTISKSYGQLSN